MRLCAKVPNPSGAPSGICASFHSEKPNSPSGIYSDHGGHTQSAVIEDFRSRYAEEKPYFEYWFGEAIQKAAPTVLHALLVKILLFALEQAGYKSGPELELRIDQNWQPKADVAAWTRIDGPYPTRPVDIVVEVLSAEDRMQRVIAKCRNY